MWIARDKDGELYLHDCKPVLSRNPFTETAKWMTTDNVYKFEDWQYPEITFENSPQRIFLHTKEQLDSLLHAEFSRGFDEGEDYGTEEALRR